MRFPSFEDLAQVVRASVRLKRDARIDPDTQFLRDLGITGKHGIDLLKVVESHYGITFESELYERVETEGLIQSEGTDESPVIQPLLRCSRPTGHWITVGRVYKAAIQELSELPDMRQHPSG